jgi:hypothetical protein
LQRRSRGTSSPENDLAQSSASLRGCISQHNNGRFSAGRAESLVAMKGFVSITMGFAQSFYLLHLAIIFFRAGKKLEQPCLEQFISLGSFLEKFSAPYA